MNLFTPSPAPLTIACIVEGHGEVEAVPILVRRLAEAWNPALQLRLPQPQRVPRTKIIKSNELERAVQLAALKAGSAGGVLVLLDADNDCPARLGPELLERAQRARSDTPISIVLAKIEFEAWFLAAAASLRGLRGLRDDLEAPPDPEAVKGAKEWLSTRMNGSRIYSETLDQPALSRLFALDAARHGAPSFDKYEREVFGLFQTLSQQNT